MIDIGQPCYRVFFEKKDKNLLADKAIHPSGDTTSLLRKIFVDDFFYHDTVDGENHGRRMLPSDNALMSGTAFNSTDNMALSNLLARANVFMDRECRMRPFSTESNVPELMTSLYVSGWMHHMADIPVMMDLWKGAGSASAFRLTWFGTEKNIMESVNDMKELTKRLNDIAEDQSVHKIKDNEKTFFGGVKEMSIVDYTHKGSVMNNIQAMPPHTSVVRLRDRLMNAPGLIKNQWLRDQNDLFQNVIPGVFDADPAIYGKMDWSYSPLKWPDVSKELFDVDGHFHILPLFASRVADDKHCKTAKEVFIDMVSVMMVLKHIGLADEKFIPPNVNVCDMNYFIHKLNFFSRPEIASQEHRSIYGMADLALANDDVYGYISTQIAAIPDHIAALNSFHSLNRLNINFNSMDDIAAFFMEFNVEGIELCMSLCKAALMSNTTMFTSRKPSNGWDLLDTKYNYSFYGIGAGMEGFRGEELAWLQGFDPTVSLCDGCSTLPFISETSKVLGCVTPRSTKISAMGSNDNRMLIKNRHGHDATVGGLNIFESMNSPYPGPNHPTNHASTPLRMPIYAASYSPAGHFEIMNTMAGFSKMFIENHTEPVEHTAANPQLYNTWARLHSMTQAKWNVVRVPSIVDMPDLKPFIMRNLHRRPYFLKKLAVNKDVFQAAVHRNAGLFSFEWLYSRNKDLRGARYLHSVSLIDQDIRQPQEYNLRFGMQEHERFSHQFSGSITDLIATAEKNKTDGRTKKKSRVSLDEMPLYYGTSIPINSLEAKKLLKKNGMLFPVQYQGGDLSVYEPAIDVIRDTDVTIYPEGQKKKTSPESLIGYIHTGSSWTLRGWTMPQGGVALTAQIPYLDGRSLVKASDYLCDIRSMRGCISSILSQSFRTICAPSEPLKKVQSIIGERLSRIPMNKSCFGFVKGRSAYECASAHTDRWKGERITSLNIDVKNFFQSIEVSAVKKSLKAHNIPEKDVQSIIGRCAMAPSPYIAGEAMCLMVDIISSIQQTAEKECRKNKYTQKIADSMGGAYAALVDLYFDDLHNVKSKSERKKRAKRETHASFLSKSLTAGSMQDLSAPIEDPLYMAMSSHSPVRSDMQPWEISPVYNQAIQCLKTNPSHCSEKSRQQLQDHRNIKKMKFLMARVSNQDTPLTYGTAHAFSQLTIRGAINFSADISMLMEVISENKKDIKKSLRLFWGHTFPELHKERMNAMKACARAIVNLKRARRDIREKMKVNWTGTLLHAQQNRSQSIENLKTLLRMLRMEHKMAEQAVTTICSEVLHFKTHEIVDNLEAEDVLHFPQGSPASPVLSNLACKLMDSNMSQAIATMGGFYTRYADDIAVSMRYPQTQKKFSEIAFVVKKILHNNKLTPNPQKTSILGPKKNVDVVGYSLNNGTSPTVSNKYRNKVRAAIFNDLLKDGALSQETSGMIAHCKTADKGAFDLYVESCKRRIASFSKRKKPKDKKLEEPKKQKKVPIPIQKMPKAQQAPRRSPSVNDLHHGVIHRNVELISNVHQVKPINDELPSRRSIDTHRFKQN